MLILVVAAGLMLGQAQQQAWQGEEPLPVTLAGKHYQLSAEAVDDVQALSRQYWATETPELEQALQHWLETRLESAFESLYQRIPDYADWYFSLGAEYLRLGHLVGSSLGLSLDDPLATYFQSHFFDDAFVLKLVKLHGQAKETLIEQVVSERHQWLTELLIVLQQHEVPAPLQTKQPVVSLDGVVSDWLSSGDAAFYWRTGSSGVAAGVAMLGPTAWRVFARRGVMVRGMLAGRVSARAGSSAGAGAMACAPSGVIAVGCALMAGAATWIATDLALLQLDEWRRREILMNELSASLDASRERLASEWAQAFRTLVIESRQAVQGDIEDTFLLSERMKVSH